MIKILYVLPKAEQGGAETQLLLLLRKIDYTKFKVHLGILYPGKELEQEFKNFKNIEIVNFHKKGPFDLGVYSRITRYARDNKINIIHTLMGNHHAYIPAIFLPKITAIGGIMGTQYDELSFPEWAQVFLFEKLFTKLQKIKLVSCSYAGKKLYIDKGFSEDHIEVIPNGFDYSNYEKGNPQKIRQEFSLKGKIILGMVGRFIETKNHRTLLQSFNILHKKRKDCILMLVGSGDTQKDIEEEAHSLHLENKVVFTGNRKDIPDLLASMDIFVFPSISEGWPNVINEALAAGLPVIAYPAGDIPHIIENKTNGIIVDNDATEIANWIIKLLDDSELRNKLKKNAKQTLVGKYTVDSMVTQYENLYKRWLN